MSSPWSSTITSDFLTLAADQLNAVDHVRFRSVCSHWRNSTNRRNTLPLIILADTNLDEHQQEKPIKALSFFDTVRKETIPFPATTSGINVHNSYFLSSSHGYIAFGFLDPLLKISLTNPFTADLIKLPMLVGQRPGGRVLLSGSPAEGGPLKPMVVYQSWSFNYPVCFMRIGDNQWRRILRRIPEDIITADGDFYVINGPNLFYFDFDGNWMSPAAVPLKFPGVLPNWVSANLKFLVNSSNKLFVVCTLSFQRKEFGFMQMEFQGEWPLIRPYVNHLGQYCYPSFIQGNRPRLVADVLDFHPYGPFSWLSKFWSDGQHPWEPVGWIFPNLNMKLVS